MNYLFFNGVLGDFPTCSEFMSDYCSEPCSLCPIGDTNFSIVKILNVKL